MPTTTSNMSLTAWDLLTDPYDNTQLANNFKTIDAHDHTGSNNKGVKIGNGALVSTSGSEAVDTNVIKDSAITSVKIATGTIANSKLANSSITIGSTAVSLGGTAATVAGFTLTSPTISTITNTGTLTLPTSTDTLVGKATSDTFTNKTYDTAGTGNVFKINGTAISDKTGTGKVVLDTSPTISGTSTSITNVGTFALRDTSAAYDVTIAATSSTTLTAARTLTLDLVNASRTLKLGGNVTTAANFTTSGANALTLTTTATTNATIPSGTVTLIATDSTDVLTNKTLTSPKLSGSSTGTTTIASANSGATSYTLTAPAANDTLVGQATTDVLTNKSLSDSTTYIVDSTDNTKKLNIDVTGTTGITGVLQTAFTTAKTIAFPDTAGTVVTTGDSATVSTTMLSTTGVSAGTYNQVTVDTKGRVTAGANIGYGASLPGSPSAGDEYYYTADPTNGVIWHLRYSGPTNKWEYVGGAPLAAVQNTGTSSTLTSTTYTYDITTIDGPSIIVPLAGTYRIEFGFDASNSNNDKTIGMGLFTSSTANTGLINGAELSIPCHNNGETYTSAKFVHYYTFVTAPTIYAQFKTSGNTATVSNRWIAIIPSKLG